MMKLPQFSDKQINRISEVLGNFGIGIAISFIIPSFLIEFDLNAIIGGTIVSAIFWLSSIKILKS